MSLKSILRNSELEFLNGATSLVKVSATTSEITLEGTGGSDVVLKGIATPVDLNDAVTKYYVDSLALTGVTWKNAANVATTADVSGTYNGSSTITISGTTTVIDTVTLTSGMRVLVKNQGSATENGIYTVSITVTDTVLTRSTDAPNGSSANGTAIFVFNGSANNDKSFVVTDNISTNWGQSVTFSIMSASSSASGSDQTIQYNDNGNFGSSTGFTFNKSSTTPILTIGSTATGTSTINIGNGANSSVIAGASNLSLKSNTGNVIIDTSTNDWTFNGTALSSEGAISILSGSGNVLLQGYDTSDPSTSGNVVLKIANSGTSTGTNNLIQFQNSSGTAIGRIENNGDIYANTFNATSDVKYKENITNLSDSLNLLKKIEGYSYNWKKDYVGYTDDIQYGVLAQQIEEAGLSNLVSGKESKSVNYIGLIPLMIEAIKELSNKIENNDVSIDRPKSKIVNLGKKFK